MDKYYNLRILRKQIISPMVKASLVVCAVSSSKRHTFFFFPFFIVAVVFFRLNLKTMERDQSSPAPRKVKAFSFTPSKSIWIRKWIWVLKVFAIRPEKSDWISLCSTSLHPKPLLAERPNPPLPKRNLIISLHFLF